MNDQLGRELLFLPRPVSLKGTAQALGSLPEILDASDMDNRQTLMVSEPENRASYAGTRNL